MLPRNLSTLFAVISTLLLTSSGRIEKRDPGNSNEVLYLNDCEAPNNLTSQITYYFDWKDSLNQERAIGKAPLPGRVKWENDTFTAALRPEIIDYQTVAINPYSETLTYRAFAGVMNTTSGLYLPCFKDNGHLQYTDDGGAKCYSQYFCIDPVPDMFHAALRSIG
ncbi:MAG: hypothetical protein Q9163_000170 [Psora crenata]